MQVVTVSAASAADAVKVVNQGISEADEVLSESLYISSKIPNADSSLNSRFRVGESMIVHESNVSGNNAQKAYVFLTEKGYEYQGDYEKLALDDELTFIKNLWTENKSGVYAFFQVLGRFDLNIQQLSFRIESLLYPVGMSRFADDGTLAYAVKLIDRQAYTTVDELPNTLEYYEEKFMELIKALRRADPIDGIPLEES